MTDASIAERLGSTEEREARTMRDSAQEPAAQTETPDRIFLRNLIREVEIGVYPEEYGVTQRLRFSIEVEIRRHQVQLEDDFGAVVNYENLARNIDKIAAGPRVKLLETFAERLAVACLEDPRCQRIHLMIEKLDLLPGEAVFGVQISRERSPG